ncbi:MAG: YciI family protein [Acidimicrobiia bacterium]
MRGKPCRFAPVPIVDIATARNRDREAQEDTTVQYAALIYDDPTKAPDPESPEGAAIFQRYVELTEQISAEGVNKGGEALYGVDMATSIRIRGGELQITDGPFAETKEHLGGFYLIEADDLDHAIKIASRIPAVETGTVELRPVWDFSE